MRDDAQCCTSKLISDSAISRSDGHVGRTSAGTKRNGASLPQQNAPTITTLHSHFGGVESRRCDCKVYQGCLRAIHDLQQWLSVRRR